MTPPTRRTFIKTSATASLAFPAINFAKPDSRKLKVGLVGCGGRGTGAANQALTADSNITLHAVGDIFPEPLEKSLKTLLKVQPGKIDIPKSRQHIGWDAYQKVIDSCDVVLLATPPQFRPLHIEAAVEAKKHIFAEKPVAVDAPGVRSVLASAAKAKAQGTFVVSGLCWRYETGMQEVMKRLHDGQIGEIQAMETSRYGRGVAKLAKRQPGWSDMEYQLRNWYYYTWLSGDFIVEMFVHELDKMAWAMKDQYPVHCIASGGRIARTEPHYGHIYDHFNAIFTYANGTKLYAGTRHQPGCDGARLDLTHGTEGRCNLMSHTIFGKRPWKWGKTTTVMHQLEHDAMYAALRDGAYINNGDYMAKSTLMAIMARQSAYTGKALTWDQIMESKEDLTPPSYRWDQNMPEPPVAIPGKTKFV